MPMFNLGTNYISDVDANGNPITFKPPKSSFAGAADPTYPQVPAPGITATNVQTAAPRISFGGYTPDYKSLIEQDPGLMAVRAGNTKSVEDAASARKAALRMLAVKYGGLPSGFTDKYGDLDQGTLDAAKNNQYSDEANLSRNYQQTLEGFRRSLAARGMLQSSELDYGQNQADISRGQQEYDLGNQFGAAAQSAVNTFAGAEGQARQLEAQSIGDAASRVYSQPGNQPTGPQSATLVGDWQAKYGQPVYDDGSGTLYDEQGNPFTPPSAAPAAPSAAAGPNDSGVIYWRNPQTGQIEVHPQGWRVPVGTAGMQ